jgi:hypothetical protein
MSADDTRHYIEHRLRMADWSGDPQIGDGAFSAIQRATGGIPRRINTLCSRLLIFGALEEMHRLDEDAVATVVADLQAELAEVPNGSAGWRHGELRAKAVPAAVPPTDAQVRLERLERKAGVHEEVLRQLMRATADLLSLWASPPRIEGKSGKGTADADGG